MGCSLVSFDRGVNVPKEDVFEQIADVIMWPARYSFGSKYVAFQKDGNYYFSEEQRSLLARIAFVVVIVLPSLPALAALTVVGAVINEFSTSYHMIKTHFNQFCHHKAHGLDHA